MANRAEEEPNALGEQTRQDSGNEFSKLIQNQYESPGLAPYFEIMLDKAGVLEPLEEAGILPVPEDLNPFDPETEEEAFEKWATAHPELSTKFIADVEKREAILRVLFVGSLLGNTVKTGDQ